jgi:predicted dehydrogenase
MKRFTAAVIGLGNIGQGYDYNDQDSTFVLTHAGGFLRHTGFELIASVDTDPKQRDLFFSKYKRPAYETTQEMFLNHHPQVISIAVPTNLHFSIFEIVSKYGPVAVLCEKPLAQSVADAESMVSKAYFDGFALLVNYIRRFEPGVLLLQKAIVSGLIGNIYKGTVWYTKGFRNNGSHFVDLLRFLFGEMSGYRIINTGHKLLDDDRDLDVSIRFGDVDICFLSGRHENFSMAEIEMVGTGGLLRYIDGGGSIEYQRVEQDAVFHEYKKLSCEKGSITTDLNHYQLHVLNALHLHLTEGSSLASDGNSALATMRTVEKIFNSLKDITND